MEPHRNENWSYQDSGPQAAFQGLPGSIRSPIETQVQTILQETGFMSTLQQVKDLRK